MCKGVSGDTGVAKSTTGAQDSGYLPSGTDVFNILRTGWLYLCVQVRLGSD